MLFHSSFFILKNFLSFLKIVIDISQKYSIMVLVERLMNNLEGIMARPIKLRTICSYPQIMELHPLGAYAETVDLSFGEYEVVRLLDTLNYSQEECARQMGLARSSIASIYDSARRKISDSIINGKALAIHGGSVELCKNRLRCCGKCGKSTCSKCMNGTCPKCNGKIKGENECENYYGI